MPDGFCSYASDDWDRHGLRMWVIDDQVETACRKNIVEYFEQELKAKSDLDDFRIFRDKRDIPFGLDWEKEISGALESSYILFCFLSPNFIKSDYCQLEFKRFLQKQEKDPGLIIIPIEWECFNTRNFKRPERKELAKNLERLQLIRPGNLNLIDKKTLADWHRFFVPIFEQIVRRIEVRQESIDLTPPAKLQLASIWEKPFQFGSTEKEIGRNDDEYLGQLIKLRRGFLISKFLVTFAEFDEFCQETGRDKPNDQGWGRGLRPVVDVSWDGAVAYCAWLSEREGRKFRLPDESEWECACRAGSREPYAFGETITPEQANYAESGIAATTPCGFYPANAWGIHDMHGNVREWTNTPYIGKESAARALAERSPEMHGPLFRVVRGGWFASDKNELRSAYRDKEYRSARRNNIGFRVVCYQ